MSVRTLGDVKFEPVCSLPDDSDSAQWSHRHYPERFLLIHERTNRWWEWDRPIHTKTSPWKGDADQDQYRTQYDPLAQVGQVLRVDGLLDDQEFWARRFRKGLGRRDVSTFVAVAGGQLLVVMSLGGVTAR